MNIQAMRARGWSEEEIAHAEALIKKAEAEQHPEAARWEQIIYWFLLLLTICGVLATSFILVPIILFMDTILISIVLALLGLCFGAFFSLLIKDLEGRHPHHAVSAALLGAIAVTAITVLVSVMNRFVHDLPFAQEHNPWPLAIVYAIALLAPFMHHVAAEWWNAQPGW